MPKQDITIGIHDRVGSFSERWISYCRDRGIPFRLVDCLASDVIDRCKGLDALLWHWTHMESSSQLVARQIIAALERRGLLVFPSTNTCFHYDDKVAQKYLLEAVGAPAIKTWVFTSKKEALKWIATSSWPKVFKLRCGAGSRNVQLVRSRYRAESLCRRAFGGGFPASVGYLADIGTRVRNTKTRAALRAKLLRAPVTLWNTYLLRRRLPRQSGYVYFQEYLEGNEFDTRVTVIGERAFGFRRKNRPGDFRASGSGNILYENASIDDRCIAAAFAVADSLKTQSLAFDFLYDRNRVPQIGEVSYCYDPGAVQQCPGHWDRTLHWVEGHNWPQDVILEDVLSDLQIRRG